MSANTTAARSMVTNFLGSIFESIRGDRSRTILAELIPNNTTLLLQKIQTVQQSDGRVIIETGAFRITIKIDVQEKVKK